MVAKKTTKAAVAKPKATDESKGPLNARVRREVTRLNKIFAGKTDLEREYIQGLVKRAAFIRVQLEDMEKDIAVNGLTEEFKQSPFAPSYTRERPAARLYNGLIKNYQIIMKQLEGFVIKSPNEQGIDDGFERFCTE